MVVLGRRPQSVTMITGGTEGIGLSLAHEFASKNHNLVLVARNEKRLNICKAKLAALYDVNIYTFSCDLTNRDACRKITSFTQEHNLYVDILINNAGMGLSGGFTEHSHDSVNALLDLNIKSLTNLTHCFMQDMIARKQGKILNVASTAGITGLPYHALYSASKNYLIAFSQAISEEAKEHNVQISVLVPGPTDTKFHDKMGVRNSVYLKLFPLTSTQVIAKLAYNGLFSRKAFIIPGFVNTVSVHSTSILPSSFVRKLFKFFWKAKPA